MKLTDLSIKRPVTTFMVLCIILLFGFIAFFKLNIDLLPSFDLPMLMVMTHYTGASPSEVEDLITEPLEGVLATTNQVSSIDSISSEGTSMMMLSFAEGTDMDFAALDVREKVDLIKPLLPNGVVSPIIMKLNPNMMPIGHYSITLNARSLSETTDFVTSTLVPTLKRIPGVANIQVTGGVNRALRLVADIDRLSTYGLSLNQLNQLIRSEYRTLPGGVIEESNSKLNIHVQSSVLTKEDLKHLVVSNQDSRPITLDELVEFEEVYAETSSYANVNGEPSILFSIQKESTANTVTVSEEVEKVLKQLQVDNPGLSVDVLFNQGVIINESIKAIGSNALIGALLAVVILFCFLKDFRTTLIMAVSIPISVITTFVFIYFFHLTLNMISLGGIALGVGMLVDNAIVVIENIHRLKQQGLSPAEAAYKGTTEVAQAVTVSTLTTISVFLPVVFVQGISAQIFKELAFTVTFSLVASLGVSFTIVPLLASRLLSVESLEKKHLILNSLRHKYKQVLIWGLHTKKKVTVLVLLVLIMGGFALQGVGFTFFPSADQGIVYITVNLPKGKTDTAVRLVCDEVLQRIKGIEDIETTSLTMDKSSSRADIMLVLDPLQTRKLTDKDVTKAIMETTKNIPGAKISASTGGSLMSSGNNGITINILGEELEELEVLGDAIQGLSKSITGVMEVAFKESRSAPSVAIQVNQSEASQYGLSSAQVANAIQNAMRPISVMTLEDEEGPIEVVLYSQTALGSGLTEIQNLTLSSLKGSRVPLSAVATYQREEGYHQIERSNQTHLLSLDVIIEGRTIGQVSKDLENVFEQLNIPEGYHVVLGGQVAQMKDSFSMLFMALGIAVLLVYMIMAAQFESFIQPLFIMMIVPIAFAGGILALFIANVPVSMPALIGFIVLSGIVVNNGIVLLDFINKLRKEGKGVEEAIIEAGMTRLQPILMTTFTTVLGLLPMTLGIGQGAEIQLPLALTVTGGLLLSTVLTLVVIPVIYDQFVQ